MTVRSRDSEDPLYERVMQKKVCSSVMPTKGINYTIKLIEEMIDEEDVPASGLRLSIDLFYDGEIVVAGLNDDFWWRSICVWWEKNNCDDENEVVDFLIDAWEKQHPKFDIEYEDGTLIISA